VKVFAGFLLAIVVIITGIEAFVFSGAYDVSAMARNEFAQGLYPGAPDLSSPDLHRNLNTAKLFWIIKNGLKMTGMPTFGVTHKDREMWNMVAFVGRLPTLKPDQYNAMLKAARQSDGHRDEPGEEIGHGGETHHH
jgi:hypothetical protein